MALFSFNLSLTDSQVQKVTELFVRVIYAINIQTQRITEGFDKVAEAISELKTPVPSPDMQKGTLVSRYRVPATQTDVSFDLVGANFKDAEGNDASAANIDLSVQSSNEKAVVAAIQPGVVSEDGKTVTASVTLAFGSPAIDAAVVEYKAVNRDTGAAVAFDSDEFIVGPGEATVGTLDSPVPLTPEAE